MMTSRDAKWNFASVNFSIVRIPLRVRFWNCARIFVSISRLRVSPEKTVRTYICWNCTRIFTNTRSPLNYVEILRTYFFHPLQIRKLKVHCRITWRNYSGNISESRNGLVKILLVLKGHSIMMSRPKGRGQWFFDNSDGRIMYRRHI